ESRPQPQPQPYDYYPDNRAQAQSAVKAPAICLMLTGVLGSLVNFANGVAWIVAPDQLRKLVAFGGAPNDPAQQQVQTDVGIGSGFLFGLLGLLIVVAAIQMFRGRTYGLAMAGAILAMINIGNLCCCLGLPFGIWALIVLVRPEVRAAFE